MDTRLLSISFLVLALELVVLLGDLGFVPFRLFGAQQSARIEEQALGKILLTNNNVRRKMEHSFIWEESTTSEDLYSYDSVLTLENSTAKLSLEGNISIKLYENTLIVVEPSSDDISQDDGIHLRFQQGDLRSVLKNKQLHLSSGDWSFKASEKSDLSFRSLKDGNIELEVSKGSVEFTNRSKPEKNFKGEPGTQWELGKKEIEKQFILSDSLVWKGENFRRFYAEGNKLSVEFEWVGEVHALEILQPDKTSFTYPLDKRQQDIKKSKLELERGLNYIKLLGKEGRVSRSISVEIQDIPAFVYLYPLPRDRLISGNNNLFSWRSVNGATKYRWQMGEHKSPTSSRQSIDTADSFVDTKLIDKGALSWNVMAFDAEGFEIKSQEFRPLFSVGSALKAPVLMPLQRLRKPASFPEGLTPKAKAMPGKKEAGPSYKPAPIDSSSNFKQRSEPERHVATQTIGNKCGILPLCAKELQKFAASTSKKTWLFYLSRISNWLLPEVYAQNQEGLDVEKFIYEFSWNNVTGADFYIIEISKTENFYNLLDTDKVTGSKYKWESSHKGIVYWRVAGGANDGTMGLFSPLQKVALAEIKLSRSEINTLPKKEPATQAAAPLPAIEAEVFPVEEKPDYQSILVLNDKKESLRPIVPSARIYSLYSGLSFSKEKAKVQGEDSSYSYQGLNPISLSFSSTTSDSNQIPLRHFHLSLLQSEWKPKDKNLLISQKKLTTNRIALAYLFYPRSKSLWGLGIKSRTTLVRTSDKTLSTEDHQSIQLQYYSRSNTEIRELDELYYSFQFGVGEKLFELEGKVEAKWDLLEHSHYRWQLVNRLSFELWQDRASEQWGNVLNIGLGLEIQWKNPLP